MFRTMLCLLPVLALAQKTPCPGSGSAVGVPCGADAECNTAKCDGSPAVCVAPELPKGTACTCDEMCAGELVCQSGSCFSFKAEPCFPSDATVTLANGKDVRIAELAPGDQIVAAQEDGSLSIDTVSLFSLATRDSFGPFVEVGTDRAAVPMKPGLRLTADHHLPVGEVCCANVVQAKNLVPGQTVWLAEGGKLVDATVIGLKNVTADGHINPLLVHGGFPVVDGVVTAFNSLNKVRFARATVPFIEVVGAPLSVRRGIASLHCLYDSEVCGKVFKYADGTVIAAPLTVTDVAAIGLATVAIAVSANKLFKAKSA